MMRMQRGGGGGWGLGKTAQLARLGMCIRAEGRRRMECGDVEGVLRGKELAHPTICTC